MALESIGIGIIIAGVGIMTSIATWIWTKKTYSKDSDAYANLTEEEKAIIKAKPDISIKANSDALDNTSNKDKGQYEQDSKEGVKTLVIGQNKEDYTNKAIVTLDEDFKNELRQSIIELKKSLREELRIDLAIMNRPLIDILTKKAYNKKKTDYKINAQLKKKIKQTKDENILLMKVTPFTNDVHDVLIIDENTDLLWPDIVEWFMINEGDDDA